MRFKKKIRSAGSPIHTDVPRKMKLARKGINQDPCSHVAARSEQSLMLRSNFQWADHPLVTDQHIER
jgi:hypothetical protein